MVESATKNDVVVQSADIMELAARMRRAAAAFDLAELERQRAEAALYAANGAASDAKRQYRAAEHALRTAAVGDDKERW